MFVARRSAVLWLRGNAASQRAGSTLAEKMRRAVEGIDLGMSEAAQRTKLERELDEKGEPFREAFVMPTRKLMVQRDIERITGRAVREERPRRDIHERNAVRRPRKEEMETDQDWPSVWPVAASFRSSVVPLPVRMGSRKKPERRPPFKTVGNLELVKVPNFLHLTPAAIERHCKAIKKFCTEWPAELDSSVKMHTTDFPLNVSFSDYVHQGTSLRDPRSRIVTLRLKLSALCLSDAAKAKLMRLAGDRYCEATDTLAIITDRCYTRKQNFDYAMYLLTALYHESNKVESWENLAQRADDLKVLFEGSESQKVVNNIASRLSSASDQKGTESAPEAPGKAAENYEDKVKKFGAIWEKYRNEKETPEMVRRYAESVRHLLAIPPVEGIEKAENQ